MPLDDLITYRDEATGERVGLPAAEVGEWTAATASLLTQECGLARSSTAMGARIRQYSFRGVTWLLPHALRSPVRNLDDFW